MLGFGPCSCRLQFASLHLSSPNTWVRPVARLYPPTHLRVPPREAGVGACFRGWVLGLGSAARTRRFGGERNSRTLSRGLWDRRVESRV